MEWWERWMQPPVLLGVGSLVALAVVLHRLQASRARAQVEAYLARQGFTVLACSESNRAPTLSASADDATIFRVVVRDHALGGERRGSVVVYGSWFGGDGSRVEAHWEFTARELSDGRARHAGGDERGR